MRPGRTLLVLLVVATSLGCKRCQPGPPPVYSDLDIFLDGGLVLAPDGGSLGGDEPVWPLEPGRDMVDWVMPAMKWGWGLDSREKLRDYLRRPLAGAGRSEAWLYGHLDDLPTESRLWRAVLDEDPDDLEAAGTAAEEAYYLEGPAAAVEVLAHSSGKTARLRDERGKSFWSPAKLEGFRCAALAGAGRLGEAEQAGVLAGALDGQSGQRTLVKVYWAQGKVDLALERAQQLHAQRQSLGTALTLAGLLLAKGQRPEAARVWEEARQRFPAEPTFQADLPAAPRPAAEWTAIEDRARADFFARRLARCGHYYTRLDFPDRARSCFLASERLSPGLAQAERLVLQGYQDPKAALALAQQVVKAGAHPMLQVALAWLYQRNGQPQEARRKVEAVLAREPDNLHAIDLMWNVCGELQDWPCLIKYRSLEGLDSHLPEP